MKLIKIKDIWFLIWYLISILQGKSILRTQNEYETSNEELIAWKRLEYIEDILGWLHEEIIFPCTAWLPYTLSCTYRSACQPWYQCQISILDINSHVSSIHMQAHDITINNMPSHIHAFIWIKGKMLSSPFRNCKLVQITVYTEFVRNRFNF